MKQLRILSILGTRPEVIKFAPVLQAMEEQEHIESIICVTGQHKEMLQQMLNQFKIKPDINLEVMRHDQTLHTLTASIIEQIHAVFEETNPDRVLVQGDTTTGFTTTLAAFYSGIPVGHIEAGLRSGDMYAPWPEEFNRRAISMIADMHFTPTLESTQNLLDEKVEAHKIYTTGNTVVDALHYISHELETNTKHQQDMKRLFPFLENNHKKILVTMHRRENLDGGIENICEAIRQIASRDKVEIIFPVHLNPKVRQPVDAALSNIPNVHLLKPQQYLPFVYLMNQADFIISDSGGVQEEAPSIKKPVLCTRAITERPEGVKANAVKLVGTDTDLIVKNATKLLDNELDYKAMQQAADLYGDGRSGTRIVQHIMEHHGIKTPQVKHA